MALFESKWMTPERANAFQGIGLGLSQLGAGQAPNLSPALNAMAQRQKAASEKKALAESGLLEKFSPEQRAILSQMEPGAAQKIIMQAMFSGQKSIPGYRRGTASAQGGLAMVGEDGPELVELPRGAKVHPSLKTAQMQEGYMQPLEPDERLRDKVGDFMFQRYQGMTPEQQLDFLNDPQNGFVPPPPAGFDPMFEQEMAGGSFDDAAAYRTAEMDAFKLMQQRPDYSNAPIEEGNLTGDQSKLVGYLRRAMFADAAMQDPRLATALSRHDNAIAGKMGALGRMYTDDNYELGKLMAEQFTSSILRKDSGAATPDEEVARYQKQFFPLAGETPEQIAAKAAIRAQEIRGLKMALGSAGPIGDQIQAEIDELIAASQKEEPGISAEDSDFLKSLGIE